MLRRRRAQLAATIEGMGFRVQTFETLADYRAALNENSQGCLLYDAATCESALATSDSALPDWPEPPVVFLTDDNEVRLIVQAMRGGAVDFLFRRSCTESDLWEALQKGIAQHAEARAAAEQRNERRRRLERLTDAEREILKRLIDGNNNREIAEQMKLTRSAVEGRRTRLMRKLGVGHVPALVKFVMSAQE
ncbi:MAG: LuxR C-terminal-related transcriptional regulator [Pirellulales bacterium]